MEPIRLPTLPEPRTEDIVDDWMEFLNDTTHHRFSPVSTDKSWTHWRALVDMEVTASNEPDDKTVVVAHLLAGDVVEQAGRPETSDLGIHPMYLGVGPSITRMPITTAVLRRAAPPFPWPPRQGEGESPRHPLPAAWKEVHGLDTLGWVTVYAPIGGPSAQGTGLNPLTRFEPLARFGKVFIDDGTEVPLDLHQRLLSQANLANRAQHFLRDGHLVHQSLRGQLMDLHDPGQAPAVNKWQRLVTKILDEPWPGATALALQLSRLSRFGLMRHDMVSAADATSIQRCLAHASWRMAESSGACGPCGPVADPDRDG